MKKIQVKSLRGNYEIRVGPGLLKNAGSALSEMGLSGKVLVVTHANIGRLYLGPLKKSLEKSGYKVVVHEVPQGEVAKSEKIFWGLLKRLVKEGFERRDILFALGGGVVGDLSGFAASCYLRGIPFVNAGTTLLAQVDSSIGGKTAVNLEEGKNLVGAFYPPHLVFSDTATLSTLPDREYSASLGEVVKYGVIRDRVLFEMLEKKSKSVLKRDKKVVEEIVMRSSSIKAGVVSRDEFETKGERMILNFGHTFGHGFEQALRYKMLHGDAVALGMICASKLALEMGLFSVENNDRLRKVLKDLRLPVSLKGLNVSARAVLSAMERDKKKKNGRLRFVLPERIGKVTVKQDIPSRQLEKILLEVGAVK